MEQTQLVGQFDFPVAYNLLATFLFALTGVILATKKRYDLIGVFILAIVAGAGGGLIRDGIFLQDGPPLLLQDYRFLIAILLAIVVGSFTYHVVKKFDGMFFVADALGLGIYGVIGAQMSINAGLGIIAAILVGFASAIGGGVLRDVLTKKEPVIFFPGQYYAAAALVGVTLFLFLAASLKVNAEIAALIAIGVTFFMRLAAMKFDLSTKPLADFADVNRSAFLDIVDIVKPKIIRKKRKNTKIEIKLPK